MHVGLKLSFNKEGEGSGHADTDNNPTLLSDDMRREMERQQWERDAQEELGMSSIPSTSQHAQRLTQV